MLLNITIVKIIHAIVTFDGRALNLIYILFLKINSPVKVNQNVHMYKIKGMFYNRIVNTNFELGSSTFVNSVSERSHRDTIYKMNIMY